MAVDPITGASHVKTRQDPTHKVILTDEDANPYDGSGAGRSQPVTLYDAAGDVIATLPISGTVAIDQTTPGDTNGVYVNNDTIEKTIGAAIGNLVLLQGISDGTNARAMLGETDGTPHAKVTDSVLPDGAATAANQQTDALTDTELRASEVPVFQSETPYNMEYEDGATAYQGWAATGTLTSQALWRIRRIVTTGADVSIKWADGNASFDNEWDNRASLSYS